MPYTVAAAGSGHVPAVVPSVIDALKMVRDLDGDDGEVTISSDTGWILTPDELEALAKP